MPSVNFLYLSGSVFIHIPETLCAIHILWFHQERTQESKVNDLNFIIDIEYLAVTACDGLLQNLVCNVEVMQAND